MDKRIALISSFILCFGLCVGCSSDVYNVPVDNQLDLTQMGGHAKQKPPAQDENEMPKEIDEKPYAIIKSENIHDREDQITIVNEFDGSVTELKINDISVSDTIPDYDDRTLQPYSAGFDSVDELKNIEFTSGYSYIEIKATMTNKTNTMRSIGVNTLSLGAIDSDGAFRPYDGGFVYQSDYIPSDGYDKKSGFVSLDEGETKSVAIGFLCKLNDSLRGQSALLCKFMESGTNYEDYQAVSVDL